MVAEELGTAIRALPGRFVPFFAYIADGNSAAIQGSFQLRKEDGHPAQEKCNLSRAAPWASGRFPWGSHFHRGFNLNGDGVARYRRHCHFHGCA